MPAYNISDYTRFVWKKELFPVFNKESVIYHGKFCKSGYASRFSDDYAMCVRVDNIRLNTNNNATVAFPFECKADGYTACSY